jgi:anhydro-N-acetylmuramic acid kinase
MGALELFLAEPYFRTLPQKSLNINDFSEMLNLMKELSDPDATATLTAMCAAGVAEAMQHCPRPPSKVLLTVGGRKNPVSMKMLEVSLECLVVEIESVGLDGDMLEA